MFEFYLMLDDYILSEIENIRNGDNLNLRVNICFLAFPKGKCFQIQDSGAACVEFEVQKSKWNEEILPILNSKRSTFVKIPIIELPNLPLTRDISKFLNEAISGLNDGRYGDVFGECRKALNVLYKGLDEWVNKELTEEENNTIKNSPEKDKIRRNIAVNKLIGQNEKGERLNTLRRSLFQYLSLDPHEADHKEVEFSRSDAILALNMTSSFASNILVYMSSNNHHISCWVAS